MKVEKKSLFFIVCLFSLFAFFYFSFLGNRPLNIPDEGRYSEVAREMLVTGDYITPRINGLVFFDKPPLNYWLQALSMKAFGVNNVAARLPLVLLGFLGCLVVYYATYQLYGLRRAQLASCILATTPLYFISSFYTDMNLPVAVFISATLLLFLLSTDERSVSKKRNFLLAAYACAGLAVLTKGLIGIVIPGAVIGLWIVSQRRWDILRQLYIVPGLFILLIITLPWFVAVQKANPEFFNYFFIYEHFTRYVSTSFNNIKPWWFYLPVLGLGLFPWSLFAVSAGCASPKSFFSLNRIYQPKEQFLVIWSVFVILFFSWPNSKMIGYILPAFPPIAILLSGRIEAYRKTPPLIFRTSLVLGSLFLSLSILLAVFTFSYLREVLVSQSAISILLSSLPLLLYFLSGLFFMSGFFIFYKKENMLALIKIVALSIIIALLSVGYFFSKSKPAVIYTSTSPLITQIQPYLLHTSKVFIYQTYRQDLPFYLKKKINVVNNWSDYGFEKRDSQLGQLAWAMQFEKEANTWMLEEPDFWREWNRADLPAIVFIRTADFKQLTAHSQTSFYLLGEYDDLSVISNFNPEKSLD